METESISKVLYFDGTRRPFYHERLEEGVQTLDTVITDMPTCSLRLLAVEVRSASKQFFWGTPSFAFVVLHFLRTEANKGLSEQR